MWLIRNRRGLQFLAHVKILLYKMIWTKVGTSPKRIHWKEHLTSCYTLSFSRAKPRNLSMAVQIRSEILVKSHLCCASLSPSGEGLGHPRLWKGTSWDSVLAFCLKVWRSNCTGSPITILMSLLHRGTGGLLPKNECSGITWGGEILN